MAWIPTRRKLAGRKPRDLSLLEGKSTRLFLEAIKSPVTQEVYKRRLATFLEDVAMDVDSFVTKAKANPQFIFASASISRQICSMLESP